MTYEMGEKMGQHLAAYFDILLSIGNHSNKIVYYYDLVSGVIVVGLLVGDY